MPYSQFINKAFPPLAILYLMVFSACSQAEAANQPQMTFPSPVYIEVTRVVEVTQTSSTPTGSTTMEAMPLATQQVGKLTGTYERKASDGSGCTLNVIHEITLEPFNKMSFELFCIRTPSYNMGYMRATILETNNIATYAIYNDNQQGYCNIVFQFQENSVEITQLGTDATCYFGGGIYANGTYQRTSQDIPSLYCLSPDPRTQAEHCQ